MIGPGTGVRVYLATGITDMRNYAESTVMRSLRPKPANFLVCGQDYFA